MTTAAQRQARRIRRVFSDMLVGLRYNARVRGAERQDAAKNLRRLRSDHSIDVTDGDIERAEREERHRQTQQSWAESKVQLVEELEQKIGKILDGGRA